MVIQDSCVETASTIVRKKTKSVLIETEDHLVRIILRQRLKGYPKAQNWKPTLQITHRFRRGFGLYLK